MSPPASWARSASRVPEGPLADAVAPRAARAGAARAVAAAARGGPGTGAAGHPGAGERRTGRTCCPSSPGCSTGSLPTCSCSGVCGLRWRGRRWRGHAAGRAFAGRVVIAHHDLLPPGRVIARLVHAAADQRRRRRRQLRHGRRGSPAVGQLGARLTVVYPGVEVPAQPPPWPPGAAGGGRGRGAGGVEAGRAGARGGCAARGRGALAAAAGRRSAARRARARRWSRRAAGARARSRTWPARSGSPARRRRRRRAGASDLPAALRRPRAVRAGRRRGARAGRPVVVPDTGGAAEIADARMRSAVPAGDADAAAAGVVSLVADGERAQALGAAGRARVRSGSAANGCAASSRAMLTPPTRAGSRATGRAVGARHRQLQLRAALLALLDSVARHLPGVRVIVVDCGSVG